MKKTDVALSDKELDALIDGVDLIRSIPGTHPELADETEMLSSQMFAPLLSALPEVDPPEDLFDSIDAEIDGLLTAPVKTQRAHEGVWEQRTDKVWKKILAEDAKTGRAMYLLRCLPGAKIKPHIHERAEHLFIIEGEFWIDGKVYSAGDTQYAPANTEHAEITMPGGCLVLVSA